MKWVNFDLLKINCLSENEIIEDEPISLANLKTISNKYQNDKNLYSLLKEVFKRETKILENIEFRELLKFIFKEIQNNNKYIYQIGFNQAIKNTNLKNYFQKEKKDNILNISLSIKNKNNEKLLGGNKNTLTLFFELIFPKDSKNSSNTENFIYWKLNRIDFYDISKFNENRNGFLNISKIELIPKNQITNIQELIDKNPNLSSVLNYEDFNNENIEFNKYLKFFKLISNPNNTFETGTIINNSLNQKFEEEKNEKNEDSEDINNFKIPENYDLIYITKNINEKLNTNINVSKKTNEENEFKKWTFNKKKITKEQLISKFDKEINIIKNKINFNKDKIKINNIDIEKNNKEKEQIILEIKNQTIEEKKLVDIKNNKKERKNIKNINKEIEKILEKQKCFVEIKAQKENAIKEKLSDNKFLEQEIENSNNKIEQIQNIINKRKIYFENKYEQGFFFYEINNIKEITKERSIYQNNDFKLVLNPLFEEKNNIDEFSCSYINPGINAKMKRYKFALENAVKGYVRNPYIISSLIFPEKEEIITKEIDNEIFKKWNLNDKQVESVKKMVSTDNTFYLQGPPGTGKTQTICATIQNYIEENKNILITSSTHEAIANCLERFDKKNSKNPNIIIFKKSKTNEEDEKNKFSQKNLYSNFIEKIMNNFIKNNEEKEEYNYFESIKENLIILENKIFSFLSMKETIKIKNKMMLIPYKVFEKIYSFKEKNNFTLKISSDNIYNYEKILQNFEINENDYDFFADLKNKKEQELTNLLENYSYLDELLTNNRHVNNYFLNEENSEILNAIRETFIKSKIIFVSLKSFKDYIENKLKEIKNKNDKNDDLFEIYYDKYIKNKNKFLTLESKNFFEEYIDKNNLVNILGYTTSSNSILNISNIENRDIWFDYPIDIVIMDEVSKSSTPEILSRINISHKFIMCGDYKQLPPNPEFDEEYLEPIFNNKSKEIFDISNNKEYDKPLYKLLNLDPQNQKFEYFFKEINDLFTKPIFKNQINIIKTKSININNNNYSFLNTQYRFNKNINALINNFYENNEKLITGNKINKFKEIKFKDYIDNKVYFIDTTTFPKKYIEKDKKGIIQIGSDSFDQKSFSNLNIEDFNDFKNKDSLESLFNEYNAYIDIFIVEELIKSNNNNDLKNNIGIICLTNSQKRIVKHLISKKNNLKELKIKVDTIDNFQGREKEIIIVDFVRAKNKFENGKILSPNKRNIDFLIEEERINVATSRAKNLLFLVGAFKYYKKEENTFMNKTLLLKYIKMSEEQKEGFKKYDGEEIYE